MKIDIEDIMFWMDAIRNSKDKYRTLESFWKGQLYSKVWLVKELEQSALPSKNQIVIHGGWNGVLASLIFNSNINVKYITSLDIDPECEDTARTINKRQEIEGRFQAVTEDMCEYDYYADIVINTSCEHLTQKQYNKWLQKVPPSATIVLQSNDYFEHVEHVNCATDLDDFVKMSGIKPFFAGELETPNYKRFMIIGKKK